MHIYTKSEISKGDRLKYRGTWYPVRRVNNKTVTVGNWLGVDSFTWHVPYAEIQAVEKAND